MIYKIHQQNAGILIFLFGIFILLILPSTALAAAEPIIIDHTCTDLSKIPNQWIEKAKDIFKISYGHTSHGSQIISGMNNLKESSDSLYWFDSIGSNDGLSLHDRKPSGDLGNPDRTTWATKTRQMLDDPKNDRNLVIWSWCGQADTSEANMQIYLDQMNRLEEDYPDITFIYMTGHLTGTGEDGNLNQRNNQIRDYCIKNDKILFDFADIESYDPDGTYFLDKGATDSCNYKNGNWADEWCAANPTSDLCASCSCAHSKPLNCNQKARAFWWMIARLAGWESDTEDDTEIDVNINDAAENIENTKSAENLDESTPQTNLLIILAVILILIIITAKMFKK